MSCFLKKDSTGSITLESVDQFNDFVATLFDEKFNDPNYSDNKFKFYIKQILAAIGNEYNNIQLNDLAKLFEDYYSVTYPGLESSLPDCGIKNAISRKYRKTTEPNSENHTMDIIDEEEQELRTNQKSAFLDIFFGSNALLKNEFKLDITNNLISSFIIDRDEGIIIDGVDAANAKVKQYKNKLFEQIAKYLKSQGIDVNTPLFDQDGNYTDVLTQIKQQLIDLNSITASKLPGIARTERYKAITSYFALTNFDKLVDLILGSAVVINPQMRGKIDSGNPYSFSEKGNHVFTTWRSSDEIWLEKEIGSLAQALINSSKFYNYGSNNASNKYIKFEDFYNVITLLKNLPLNPIASKIIIDTTTDWGYDIIEEYGQEFINKSFRTVINNIRLNPQKYLKVAFDLITKKEIIDQFGFTARLKDLIWSVYKGFFDSNDNSIYAILSKYNFRSKNYYELLTQTADSIFDVNFIQYNENDGIISVRMLRDQAADNIRRGIELGVLLKNSRDIIGSAFEENDIIPHNITEIKDSNIQKFQGINFEVDIDGTKYYIQVGDLGKYINIRKDSHTGQEVSENELLSFFEKDGFFEFIDEQLGLNLVRDERYRHELELEYNSQGNVALVKDLFDLASITLLNKYISNVTLKGISGYRATNNKLKEIFAGYIEYKPRYDSTLGEMRLIPDNKIFILEHLASAKSATQGVSTSIQVKDAEGNMLSSQTLSRLLGSMTTQWEEIRKSGGAASEFSLLTQSGLYTGFVSSKELRTPAGNKPTTQFTVAEALQSNFLYDFVAGFINTDDIGGKRVFGNNVIGILPAVISDKSTIGRIILDLKTRCNGQYKVQKPDGSYKTYAELTDDEWEELICTELGNYYKKHLEQVNAKFTELSNNLKSLISGKPSVFTLTKMQELGLNAIDFDSLKFDHNNDFRAFKRWVAYKNAALPKNQQKTEAQWLFELTNLHNQEYRNTPIQIIDQVDCINEKGVISRNYTTKELSKRFTDPSRAKFKQFLEYKKTELLKSMIDEGFELSVLTQADKLTPQAYLATNYSTWIGGIDSSGADNYNGKMTLAIINFNGKQYKISNKQDFKAILNIINLTNGTNIDFLNNPHEFLNPSHNVTVDLHPMLNKYNRISYLFSLEFILSTVGSHIAHPGKFKSKISETITNMIKGFKDNPNLVLRFKNYNILSVDSIPLHGERTSPIPMSVDRQAKLIKVDWKVMYDKFETKAWTKPARLHDGTFAQMLDKDEFDTFEDFVYFALEHENQHLLQEPKRADETFGDYETRINNAALNVFRKLKYDELMGKEAARYLAQHKRNVSLTAAMHEFLLNQITGIPTNYNMAIIDDIVADVYTLSGNEDNWPPLDGATFVNPLVVYWENNSLTESKAGIDKKQFIHFYDDKSGTGGIVKTAGFGITNDRANNDLFWRTMAKNMMDHQWINEDGSIYMVKAGGILKNFEGQDVNYGPIYFTKNGKYYLREFSAINESDANGNPIYLKHYILKDTEVDINGNVIGQTTETEFIPKSNYDIWQMFGGWKSMSLNEDTQELEYSESSLENTAKAANEYGHKKIASDKIAKTAEDVFLPMKHSDIHYMPTKGAIKQGMANLNSKDYYYSSKNKLNFMKVRMLQAGIQLDKEHHADQGELSLMTLVISAAAAHGYSNESVSKLYQAIYNLTKSGTKEFRDKFGKIINVDFTKLSEENTNAFNNAVAKAITTALIESSSSEGNMLNTIAADLIRTITQNTNLKFDDEFRRKVDETIPYSSSEVFNKVVNIINVMMTKSGIKIKMPGLLSVLCPTHEIIKLYKIPAVDTNGLPLLDEFGNQIYKRVRYGQVEDHGFDIDELQAKEAFITNPVDIEIGYKYLVKINGIYKIAHITFPHQFEKSTGRFTPMSLNNDTGIGYEVVRMGYETLKQYISDNKVESIQEWIRDGLDLKSYNVRFTDATTGLRFQIADLAIVLDYFKLRKSETQLLDIIKYAAKYGKQNELIARMRQKLQGIKNQTIQPLINDLFNDFIQGIDISAKIKQYDKIQNGLGTMFLNFATQFGLGFMNRQLQITLNGLSKNGKTDEVLVHAPTKTNPEAMRLIKVDKNTVDIRRFGCIMPKVFKSNFGLEKFDQVEEIKNDPNFFRKRLVEKLATRCEIYDTFDDDGNVTGQISPYDLELKRMDGLHLYILQGNSHRGLVRQASIFKLVDPDGTIWRVNSKREKMYQLFSDLDEVWYDQENNEVIVTPEETWTDSNGNLINPQANEIQELNGNYIDTKTGEQVFPHSGLLFYLDHAEYLTFHISRLASDKLFSDIIGKAKLSKNEDTKRLAGIISKRGNLDELKEFVESLNNYEKILNSDIEDLKDPIMRKIQKMADNMRTSFLQSLKIVAARIPSQSLQSFMAMEVEAFDNPDINTAYVSVFQFYLQGSDLDIDAVSLQTFDFDHNGKYVGHSPYFNLENEALMEVSKDLPFPTGEKLSEEAGTIKEVERPSETTLVKNFSLFSLDEVNPDNLFQIHINEKNGLMEVSINTSSVENINKLSRFLEENKIFYKPSKSTILALINALNTIFRLDNVSFTALRVEVLSNFLLKTIDKHNDYINKLRPQMREKMLKNYAISLLYDIISDPINLILAQSSVDGITDPAKELGKKSSKASVQSTFTPGNVVNMFLSIFENIVGKDGIAICATGLKSFFALTTLYQEMLNGNFSLKERDALLFNVNISGLEFNGLANGFTKQFDSDWETSKSEELRQQELENYSEKMRNYLFEQLWKNDAALDMSAFLGLSADNAKELILAKLNAGLSTLGMYIYGFSIGMSVQDLNSIIASPLGYRIAELTKGNLFNGDLGTITVRGALDYLRNDPELYLVKFGRIDLEGSEMLSNEGKEDTFNPEQFLSNVLQNVAETYAHADDDLDKADLKKVGIISYLLGINGFDLKSELSKYRKYITKTSNANETKLTLTLPVFKNGSWTFKTYTISKINENQANQYIALYNQAIDFLSQYCDDVLLMRTSTYSNIYGTHSVYHDFEKLAEGAEEMKHIGQMLKLNLQIKTNLEEYIMQIGNIESCIVDRISYILGKARREGKNALQYANGHPELLGIITDKEYKDKYMLDLKRFLTDSQYADGMIKVYDKVKASYNPLRIFRDVKHYRGYLESLYISDLANKIKSTKYRVLADYVLKWMRKNKVSDKRLRQQVVKNAQNAIDYHVRRMWLRGDKISGNEKYMQVITLPPSTNGIDSYAFVDSLKNASKLKFKKKIVLGTDLGDANFKLWMERVVIPELKRRMPNNKFILDLTPTILTRTNLGFAAVNMGLGSVNMMPRSEYERDVFNEYKTEFNKLASAELFADGDGNVYQVQDLFYMYSMIANNGRLGQTSMHSIFEDYITTSAFAASYRSAVGKFDSAVNYEQFVQLLTDEQLAPIAYPTATGPEVIKYKDRDTLNIRLMRKKHDKQNNKDNDGNDGNYPDEDYPGFDPYELGIVDDPMIEEFGENDSSPTFQYYKFDDEALIPNNANKSFFNNPVSVRVETIMSLELTEEEKQTFHYLAKFADIIRYSKGGLVDIAHDSGFSLELIDIINKKLKGKKIMTLFKVPGLTVDEVLDKLLLDNVFNDILKEIDKQCPPV